MKNVLDEIIAYKRIEVERAKSVVPLEQMRRKALATDRIPLNFVDSIKNDHLSGIIAEYKIKSPSKGVINDTVSVAQMTATYQRHKASAISILTDEKYFGGIIDFVREVRSSIEIPILRKEFIVDAYQIYEAKVIGADVILLIAECLGKAEIVDFCQRAKDLGLQVLLELHSEEQLDKIPLDIDAVGVNNRDLKTFEVDFESSIRLLEHLPSEAVRIAESGLRDPKELVYLYQSGFDGFLIGETFMKQKDPEAFFARFVNSYLENR